MSSPGRHGARRGRHLAALTAVAAGATLFLGWRFSATPPALGTVFPYDLLFYYAPVLERAAARLAAGELPLWNPAWCSGMPLLATLQVAALYPPTWLALVLPLTAAIPAGLALHGVGGGLGMAFLCRALGASLLASALASVLFVFALLLGQSFWPPQVATLAWLPWIAAASERVLRDGRWLAWVGLTLAVALQLLAGFPQFVLYTSYLVAFRGALVLARELAAGRLAPRAAALRAGAAAAAFALGAGLAAVQLVPTLELAGESLRAAPLPAAELQYRTGERTLALRELLRNAVDPAPKLVSFGYGRGTGYLGALTLVCIAAAAVAPGRRAESLAWLAFGGVAGLLSFGPDGPGAPLYALYTALPTGRTFRDPERLRALTLVAAVVLAAYGFDALRAALRGRGGRVVLLASGAVALLLLAASPLQAAWRLGLPLLALLLASSRPALAPACAVALLAIVALDLGLATEHAGSLRGLPVDWARQLHSRDGRLTLPDAVGRTFVTRAGEGRLATPSFDPMLPLAPLDAARRIACYEPLAPRPWATLQRRMNRGGPLHGILDSAGAAAFPTLYDATSTTLIVETREQPGGAVRAEPIPNPDTLPRAYLAFAARVAPAEASLLRLLDPAADLRSAVEVESPVGLPARAPDGTALQPAEIVVDEPERVVVRAEATAPALLVLTDTYFPGWEATVDGVPAPIVRANGAHRAIAIAPGAHEVELRYRPASLRRGALVSAGSVFLLTALAGVAARRTLHGAG